MYQGNWKNGKMDGLGKYIYEDGTIMSGEFENDEFKKGVMEWLNGMKYEGNYKDELRNGDGVLIWPNGDRYEGIWLNHSRHGDGIFIKKGGSVYKQYWDGLEDSRYGIVVPLKNK